MSRRACHGRRQRRDVWRASTRPTRRDVDPDRRRLASGQSSCSGAGRPARPRRPRRSRSSSTAGGSSSRSRTPARADLRDRATAAGRRPARHGPTEVRAIIPGRVVSVAVTAGDAVTAGQPLLAVEAMKMQNELRAPRDGTVERVDGRGRADGRARRPRWWSSDEPRRADRATGGRGRTRPATAGARPSGPRPSTAAPERREPFETSSGIEIRDLYTPADLAGLDEDRDLGRPGRVPVHPRRPADDVPQPLLDDAPVRRLRHGRGDQPALPLPARPGPDRPVGRLRPADPDGLRLRRPGGRGRGRPGRRPDLAAWPTWRSCSTACRSARSPRR